MKRYLIYFCLVFLGVTWLPDRSQGQDPNYSQYFSAPLYYNPAFTGINSGVRARFVFRDQWPNLPVPFKSYYFSADLGDRNLPGAGGIGLMVNSNNEGIGFINDLEMALTIGVRIPITSFMVSQVGIKAAVVQKRVNWDDFVFSDQLSERYGNIFLSSFTPPDINKRVYPDFAAGGILQFSNSDQSMTGTMGLAVDHIFKPDEAFLANSTAQVPRKWIVHGDAVFAVGSGGSSSSLYSHGAGDALRINPGVLFQSQAKRNTLQLGLNLLKYNIYVGGWWRSTLTSGQASEIILLAGYRYTFAENMSIKFIYSYDLETSHSLQGTGGAHEISIVLEFDKVSLFGGGSRGGFVPSGNSRRNGGPMECPSFY